jgi:hypothetical protein
MTLVSLAVARGCIPVRCRGFWVCDRSDSDLSGQLFELARQLHQDLTTGAVQDARNRLGHVAHGSRALTKDHLESGLDAYFRLLWCFERINAGRNVMCRYRVLGRGPRRFLDELISWHVKEWATNFGDTSAEDGVGIRSRLNRALASSGGLRDSDSWQGFKNLACELGMPVDVLPGYTGQ